MFLVWGNERIEAQLIKKLRELEVNSVSLPKVKFNILDMIFLFLVKMILHIDTISKIKWIKKGVKFEYFAILIFGYSTEVTYGTISFKRQ